VWLLISRRTLGEISVTIRGHPHALPNLPASSKRRFLLRSDDNLASHNPGIAPEKGVSKHFRATRKSEHGRDRAGMVDGGIRQVGGRQAGGLACRA